MESAQLKEEVPRGWKREGIDRPRSSLPSATLSTLHMVCLIFLTALTFLDSTPLTELPCQHHQLLLAATLTLGLLLLWLVSGHLDHRRHHMKGNQLVKSLPPDRGWTSQLFWEVFPILVLLSLPPPYQEPSMLRTLKQACWVLRHQEAKDPLDNKWVLQDLKACHLDHPECLQDLPFSLQVIKDPLQDSELCNCSKFSLSWDLPSDLKDLGRKT